MARLHLFNPDNDLALASGAANFTAPKAAAALRQAGAALPLWYGEQGDSVLAYGINRRWLETHYERFGETVSVYDHQSASRYVASPWGWSAASRRTFEREGFDAASLPTDSEIETWRQLSHRRTAAMLRDAIAERLDFEIAPAAVAVSDTADLRKLLGESQGLIIKSPWSSSGRGLLDTRRVSPDEVLRRCEGTISRQGCVMIEEAYEREADFALLFDCEDGKCDFVGYSVFKTDVSGSYTGNLLAPDDKLLEIIGRHYPAERIVRTAEALRSEIQSRIAGIYSGPLGVDMLIARRSDGPLLDATVELNLRMTMGFVAHSLAARYLSEGSEGEYSVMPAKNTPDSDDMVVEARRMVSGRINLTPPDGQFRFVVDVHTL